MPNYSSMTSAEIKSLLKKAGLYSTGNRAKLIAKLRRLPEDKARALRMAATGIFEPYQISLSLHIPETTIRTWWRKSGIPLALPKFTTKRRNIFTHEFSDRAKTIVFDLIDRGWTNTQISAATDISLQHISEWRKETGIPSTRGKKKYLDEELIELAYLNQGATVKRFAFILGADEFYVLQLFEDLRVHTNGEQDLYSFLEDTTVRQEFNWGNVKQPIEIRLKRLLW